MTDTLTILLIIGLPLLSFLVLGIFGNSQEVLKKAAGFIGTAFMAIASFLAIKLAWQYFFNTAYLWLSNSNYF
jgi:hypothetical protein